MDKRIVFVMLAVLLVVGWLCWSRDDATVVRPDAACARLASTESAAAAVAEADVLRNEGPADRAPVVEAAAACAGSRDVDGEPLGELHVQVVFADERPAPHIRLFVAREAPGGSRPVCELVSDAAGGARTFAPLGKVQVKSDRGGVVETKVVAGAPCVVRLKIAVGLEVNGIVRDPAGAPVAGAHIWLTSHGNPWCAGAFVERTDKAGAFRLHAVPKAQSLGAVAAGFAPSELVDLQRIETRAPWGRLPAPVQIELQLRAGGGALAGRVVDESGDAVAGAVIAIGTAARMIAKRKAGTEVARWGPRRAVTDADGGYAMTGLEPGTHAVEAWSRAHAVLRSECTVAANATARLDLTLLRPVTVHGVVLDENGLPHARALVRASAVVIPANLDQPGQPDFEGTFGSASAFADATGRYRLSGVAPGEVHLHARASDRSGFPFAVTTDTLLASPGAWVEWNPRLGAGPTIRGVVRYRDGAPMARTIVMLLEPGATERRAAETDLAGRFRFVGLQPKGYDLAVQHWTLPKDAEPAGARDVWPDAGEVQLVAGFDSPTARPSGSVRGAVSDPAGRLASPGALHVTLVHEDGQRQPLPSNLAGGSFHFKDVAPGRMRVIVLSGNDPILHGPWFELLPAEHKHVGTLVTEPGGRLLLGIVRHPGTEAVAPHVHLTPHDGSHSRTVEVGQRITELVIDNLCTGEQRIECWSPGAVATRGTACTIVAGQQARATIELRPAAARELAVEYTATQRLASMRVHDERGGELFAFQARGVFERPFRIQVPLPLGQMTLLVETEGGGKAETTFEMTSLAENQPPVVLKAQ